MSWLWDGGGDQVDFITDDLAVASLEAAWDLQKLIRHGIRAIVDVSNRDGNPRYAGIHYHEVRIARRWRSAICTSGTGCPCRPRSRTCAPAGCRRIPIRCSSA
ncbi:MAG: hypothetical protein HY803_00690 [candidate division NC10 bacterium]|nr:hypothetical protein [candidate division NC10 bacterium]